MVAPGPGCKRRDRSLSVWVVASGNVRVHSHRGLDWRTAQAFVRERLGQPAWSPRRRAALKAKPPLERRCQFLNEGLRIIRYRQRISPQQFSLLINDLRNLGEDPDTRRLAADYAREFKISADVLEAALAAQWRPYTAAERAAVFKTTYQEFRELKLRRSGCNELTPTERRQLTRQRYNQKRRAARAGAKKAKQNATDIQSAAGAPLRRPASAGTIKRVRVQGRWNNQMQNNKSPAGPSNNIHKNTVSPIIRGSIQNLRGERFEIRGDRSTENARKFEFRIGRSNILTKFWRRSPRERQSRRHAVVLESSCRR